MTATPLRLIESPLPAADAAFRHVQLAGEPWLGEIRKGQTVRIVDLEGNQAVDVLFYSSEDPAEHYSMTETIAAQQALYLTAGTVLYSSRGRGMLEITADTCGRHDTLGGACSAESNTVRYALKTKPMHSCRDNFLTAISKSPIGLSKRDIAPNINFFMNVPVTADGTLRFEDGVSAPLKYVEMTALMDVWMLSSNCPQLNNPCNAYNPTPVEILVWDPS